ncbi:MAG: hypothetical protein WC656_04940 [Sulfurimonas sp.]
MEKIALSNKLNFRVQGVNNSKIVGRIKHNIRHVKSLSHLTNKNNILINLQENKQYEFLSSKNSLSKRMYKDFIDSYNEDRESHNQKFKNTSKRSVREYHGSWSEGILTFSEAINEDLGTKYSQVDLIDCAKELLKEFEIEWKTEVKMVVLHMDEKTPHFQFFFKNFDELGNSIIFQNRGREALSSLQDLMFKHFSKLGMERGIKKLDKDCGIVDYSKPNKKKAELELELKNLKSEIQALKEQRKIISQDNNLAILDKKKVYEEITIKQENFRFEMDRVRHQIKQDKQEVLNLVEKAKKLNAEIDKLPQNRIETASKIILYKDLLEEQDKEIKVLKSENAILNENLTTEKNKVHDLNFYLNQEKNVNNDLKIQLSKFQSQSKNNHHKH